MQVVVIRSAGTPARSEVSWRAVESEVNAHGRALRPMHPSAHDPELRRYFVVEVEEPKHGEELVRALASLPDVDSVYLKPSDEAP
ncbi:MAG TPA: hypothetical protein VJV78_17220 [Polyangiales bacterium]|nr:hypothetical protein [Polyangiales bacterium]